ncbi:MULTISPECIES: IPT/TIG domain-containing protein [unclassified Streptomyces]|uniref:IPT/TIG domain-containing protein n=1 Tax=unclassified Streptomyces TaxID=2593676 RepID=UPI0003783271|nr:MULTISPECIES: IPT/TIG domain-containing protein [unclassified Streptomyces]MYX38722.1 cell surface protein [Streptomyces sp. SID8377]
MPISPNQGSTAGGTVVTITGVNLAGATAVRFGTRLATITANTPTSITVVSPSGSGAVNVTVTTAGGTSNPLPFYYIGAPFKQSISPISGPSAGGQSVTINGTGLYTASSVAFGSNTAVPAVVSDGQITVVTPSGTAGSVSVSVTTAGGTNNGFTYTYFDAPTLTSVTPAQGPASSGTSVTLIGTALTSTSSVTFDGNPAHFTVINSSVVSATAPAGTVGTVDVTVTTDGGSATAVGAYTYLAGPGI